MIYFNTSTSTTIITGIISCDNCTILYSKNILTCQICRRCGKCITACPATLSPVLIKDNLNNIEELKKLHVEKCIECSSCSYICPSGIKIRECVKLAKEKIKEVK